MEDPSPRPSTYTPRNKKYYETHKDELKAKRQEKRAWIEYYQKNSEKLKEKRRQAYQRKKAVAPPTQEPQPQN
jgi:hypothetical protein